MSDSPEKVSSMSNAHLLKFKIADFLDTCKEERETKLRNSAEDLLKQLILESKPVVASVLKKNKIVNQSKINFFRCQVISMEFFNFSGLDDHCQSKQRPFSCFDQKAQSLNHLNHRTNTLKYYAKHGGMNVGKKSHTCNFRTKNETFHLDVFLHNSY